MLQQKLPHANLDVNTPRSFSHVLGLLLSLLCHCKHFGMFLHSCVFCQKKPAESRSVLFLSAICHIDLNLDMNLFTFQ